MQEMTNETCFDADKANTKCFKHDINSSVPFFTCCKKKKKPNNFRVCLNYTIIVIMI